MSDMTGTFARTLQQVETIGFDVDGQRIAALRRPAPARASDNRAQAAPRLLCLHGWLDNAASFVPLMPHLPHADIVAIDCPGTGESAWLEGGYTLPDLAYRCRRVLQALGWSSCHLVGHSLGGCIAPLLAVSAPDCCQSLTMIEANGPLAEEADALPARSERAMSERLDLGGRGARTFADIDAAVAVRLKAARMARASAQLIVERQLERVDAGYRWRFDPRWRLPSPQYQTEAQVRANLAAVAVPTLVVLADDGFLVKRPETEPRLDCLQHGSRVTLAGQHHVHMDTPEPVADAMRAFLDEVTA